jgi:Tol biopolymer transport system component
MEEKGYIRNPRVIEDGFVFTDNYASAIYLYRNGKTEVLTDSRGSGLYYMLAPDMQRVGFKFIDQNGMQSPAIIDLNNGEIRRLTEPSQRVGQPGFTRDGRVAYTVGSRLIISDGREVDLGV